MDLAQTDAMTEGCYECETRLDQAIGSYVIQSAEKDWNMETSGVCSFNVHSTVPFLIHALEEA